LTGWGARGNTWEYQASIQHQLAARISITGGYYYRWLGNQLAVQNTLVTAASYDGPFCVTAPGIAQLPNSGGYKICGLYDLNPSFNGAVQNNTTFARSFGGVTDHYQGFDLS